MYNPTPDFTKYFRRWVKRINEGQVVIGDVPNLPPGFSVPKLDNPLKKTTESVTTPPIPDLEGVVGGETEKGVVVDEGRKFYLGKDY